MNNLLRRQSTTLFFLGLFFSGQSTVMAAQEISIRVFCSDQEWHHITVSTKETVGKIKEGLIPKNEETANYTISSSLFCGCSLDESKTIEECGIQNNQSFYISKQNYCMKCVDACWVPAILNTLDCIQACYQRCKKGYHKGDGFEVMERSK